MLGWACKPIAKLDVEDWHWLKELGIRAAVRGCRAGRRVTQADPGSRKSTSHIPQPTATTTTSTYGCTHIPVLVTTRLTPTVAQ